MKWLFVPFLEIGSGDWIRTSDLVVTRVHDFHRGVDYLFTLGRCRALMRGYCSAHSLVSEPSVFSKPKDGLAADYRVFRCRLPDNSPYVHYLVSQVGCIF